MTFKVLRWRTNDLEVREEALMDVRVVANFIPKVKDSRLWGWWSKGTVRVGRSRMVVMMRFGTIHNDAISGGW